MPRLVELLGSTHQKYTFNNEYRLNIRELKVIPSITNAILKNINSVNSRNLREILEAMNLHQVGNRAFYEILSLQFVRNLDKLSFEEKGEIAWYLAQADVDASTLIKSLHAILASSLEVTKIYSGEISDKILEI